MLKSHVIFDLDGTLLNTIDDLADAGNYICRQHGWPTHTVDEYKLMVGNGIPVLVERFTPDGLGEDELAQALAEFSAYYGEHKADKTAPYAGVADAVRMLKAAGAEVAVLSNKAHELAGPVVEGYFPGLFSHVQGALPGVPLKPDPTLLKQLMAEMGATPEDTLFVGDSGVDVRTGKNGGLIVCGVTWGFRDETELMEAGADVIIRRPGDICSVALGTALLTAEETERAAEILNWGIVTLALPTETVYGLAADATSGMAVRRIYEVKGRAQKKPLSVLVDGMPMVETVCKNIPNHAYKLADAFWPGPLTMILESSGTLPAIVTAGGSTQGVRCPDHPVTLAVIRALGRPLACPSANLSGKPSPKTAAEVFAQLEEEIYGVLDGGPCTVGVESTILDLTVTPYRILRQGALSRERIEDVLGAPVDDITENKCGVQGGTPPLAGSGVEPRLVLGLTGPSGAGKTTALRALEDLGAVVIDCDKVYHELTYTCKPMMDEIRARFGDGVFAPDGSLDRKALGKLVFGDRMTLFDLSAITHRYVAAEVDRLLAQAAAEGKTAAIDAVALIESGIADRCDVTVAVTAPQEVCLGRIMARDGIDETRAAERLAAQKAPGWFEKRCDRVLRNGGEDPEEFYRRAKALFQSIITQEGDGKEHG